MDHGCKPSASSSSSASPSTGDMPGMDHMASGNGLSAQPGWLPPHVEGHPAVAGKQAAYRFTVTGPDGKPLTDFTVDQTKRMHFYAIRSDLTGPQHVPPNMAVDGTWRADLSTLTPGSWCMFASFTPNTGTGMGDDFVASRTVAVSGNAVKTRCPHRPPARRPTGTPPPSGASPWRAWRAR
ncbi:hypothetical protein [Streptomyces sp. NPDC058385]|uniref:hypothetical protein n=1 Tax=Streptomyces sp. NPDC058385 TaxID=3346473 RepID=UPI003667D2F5